MSKLREAAKAALTAYEEFRDVDDIDGLDDAMDRLRSALAQPETEPVAWQSRYIGRGEPFGEWRTIEWPLEECANLTRGAVEHMRAQTDFEVRPLYTHPPRDEWRPPEVTVLPDGSAFGMMSFPLPYDHWMYRDREYLPGADEPVDLPKPILTHALCEHVEAAVRYAVRGATNCGKELDFDPDALVLNAVYALCGPYGGASLRDIEPPTESTIATEIKAARNEFATWPKERQDAARVSAVAMTPPTEGE